MIVKLRGVMMESPAACLVAVVSFFLSWEGSGKAFSEMQLAVRIWKV